MLTPALLLLAVGLWALLRRKAGTKKMLRDYDRHPQWYGSTPRSRARWDVFARIYPFAAAFMAFALSGLCFAIAFGVIGR
jgi:hypothetical protein